LKAGSNDDYAIGYYVQTDLAFLGAAAPSWTTCDSYFSAIMSETLPNRIYQHAAQTDRLDSSLAISTLPTIWDRLTDHSLNGKRLLSATGHRRSARSCSPRRNIGMNRIRAIETVTHSLLTSGSGGK
jgi:phospholipase C